MHLTTHGFYAMLIEASLCVVQHSRQSFPCDADGEILNLAGPQGHNAVMDGRQRKSPNAVKKTSHGDNSHFAAATTVRAILTALCAV